METLEAQTREKSDKTITEDLLLQYLQCETEVKKANSDKRAIETQLLELAEKHTEWFDGKTATFENGKLRWVAISTVNLPDEFDMKAFVKRLPNLVKISESLQISKLRPYMEDSKLSKEIGKFGISISVSDKFKVEK